LAGQSITLFGALVAARLVEWMKVLAQYMGAVFQFGTSYSVVILKARLVSKIVMGRK
jgi:hypothetical protein